MVVVAVVVDVVVELELVAPAGSVAVFVADVGNGVDG